MKQIHYKKRLKWIITVMTILIFLCAALNQNLKTQHYSIYSEKIENAVTIVMISDLHSQTFGKNQKDLLTSIIKQNPDLILLVGDIFDYEYSPIATEIFLQGIQHICPIYFVTGNHEYASKDVKTIKEMLLAYNIKILSYAYDLIEINGNKLLLGGIDDPVKARYDTEEYLSPNTMKQAFSDLQTESYNILLAHRPESISNYKQYDFDLVLSGHAHGGQVRIPFIVNGLYAPNQGWFPPYAGGLYNNEAIFHIVSRGLGNNVSIPRIFNPPEIVVINLAHGNPD